MGDAQDVKIGSICHVEMPAPDLNKAMTFYSDVFGWTMQPISGGYVIFRDGVVGGGFDAGMPVGDAGPRLVLAVEDIDAKLEEIVAAGGERVQEKTEIGGGMGFYAYFRDPNGNQVGIWTRE